MKGPKFSNRRMSRKIPDKNVTASAMATAVSGSLSGSQYSVTTSPVIRPHNAIVLEVTIHNVEGQIKGRRGSAKLAFEHATEVTIEERKRRREGKKMGEKAGIAAETSKANTGWAPLAQLIEPVPEMQQAVRGAEAARFRMS